MKKILFVVVFILLLNVVSAVSAELAISEGQTVKFHYTLTVDGAVYVTTMGGEPYEYVHGQRSIVPGLEKQL